jgi:outer membrane protein OmpA-like peptidoglycan-associated protein
MPDPFHMISPATQFSAKLSLCNEPQKTARTAQEETMKSYLTLLTGGTCWLGLALYPAMAGVAIDTSPQLPKTESAIVVAEETTAPQPAEAAPAVTGGLGITQYYGSTPAGTKPGWAADAKMNPDYAAAKAGAKNDAASAAASAKVPAWAEDAKMNPDYLEYLKTKSAAVGTSSSEATAAASEPAPKSASQPAWAAPAKMNPDYKPSSHAAAKPAAHDHAPAQHATAENCRAALMAEVAASELRFDNAKSDIARNVRATLDRIAKIAKNCGNVVIEVSGYTDDRGSPEVNKQISERRAARVVSYLVGAGVDAKKLKAVGYGQERPIASNDTNDGRRKNRRVEFVVTAE